MPRWCFKLPRWCFKLPRWDFLLAYPASRHPSIRGAASGPSTKGRAALGPPRGGASGRLHNKGGVAFGRPPCGNLKKKRGRCAYREMCLSVCPHVDLNIWRQDYWTCTCPEYCAVSPASIHQRRADSAEAVDRTLRIWHAI